MADFDISDIQEQTRAAVACTVQDGSIHQVTSHIKTSDSKRKQVDVKPSGGKKQASKAKAKRPMSAIASEDDADEPLRKPKSRTSSAKKAKKFKSVAIIEDSDIEFSAEPPKKRLKSGSVEMDASNSAVHSRPTSPSSAPKLDSKIVEHSGSSVTLVDPSGEDELPDKTGDKSESEMSVLIDASPKRRHKKGKDKDTGKKVPKTKKGRQPAKELSKDEETIKRLKSFVVACGVRKVWAKEFKDLEKSSDQIRRLKTILSDLGMTGRMSMEQAKSIREKREFEQELEDVKQFHQKITSGPGSSTRTRRKNAPKEASEDEDEDENSSEEAANAPKRRRATAHQSIMAFLGDQSDDD